MSSPLIDQIRTRSAEARAHLDAPNDQLDRLGSGVETAGEVGILLHQAAEQDVELDGGMIAEVEALIRSTLRSFPLLAQAEADVLELLNGGDEVSIDVGAVERLARARSVSVTAAMDLHRGLALAYEKHLGDR